MYDATARRFTQEDPIRSGRNWYGYVGNDPVNYVDPWGLVTETYLGGKIIDTITINGIAYASVGDLLAKYGGGLEPQPMREGTINTYYNGKMRDYAVKFYTKQLFDNSNRRLEFSRGGKRYSIGGGNILTFGDTSYISVDYFQKFACETLGHHLPLWTVTIPELVTGDKEPIGTIGEFKRKYGNVVSAIAAEYGISENVLGAVLFVESNGSGFTGELLKIRFENHIFNDYTNNRYTDFIYDDGWQIHLFRTNLDDTYKDPHTGKMSDEYAILDFAIGFDEEAAYRSISMGLPQIMGFNYEKAGYSSAKDMFQAFSTGHEEQLRGFATYIKNNSGLIKSLQNKDYRSFVEKYNGPGQVDYYLSLLINAEESYGTA